MGKNDKERDWQTPPPGRDDREDRILPLSEGVRRDRNDEPPPKPTIDMGPGRRDEQKEDKDE